MSTHTDTDHVTVTQTIAGLWQVRLPMPYRLSGVNAWVGMCDDGKAVIIDAGMALMATENWTHALSLIGVAPAQVKAIIITHYHPDHIGGSGPLHDLTGAPVYASPIAADAIDNVWGSGRKQAFTDIDAHLLEHGMDLVLIRELDDEKEFADVVIQVPDTVHPLSELAQIEFAGTSWELVDTPGHAPGHICLYSPTRNWLIAGDHLLEFISPAVGMYPEGVKDPLADYLSSLEKTASMDIAEVFPGHGEPFTGAKERSLALIEHHRQRLETVKNAVSSEGSSAKDVAVIVFGPQKDAANTRFAQAEALSHLEYLHLRSQLGKRMDDDGIWRFYHV